MSTFSFIKTLYLFLTAAQFLSAVHYLLAAVPPTAETGEACRAGKCVKQYLTLKDVFRFVS